MRDKAILQYKKTLDLLTPKKVIRETGFYVVKLYSTNAWTILLWDANDQVWLNYGSEDVSFDNELLEIGPKIELPS